MSTADRYYGQNLDDPWHTRVVEPLQRWVKVQQVGAASRHLRAWVNREHDERPTRDELREWVRLVLDDRAALAERPTVAEFETLKASYERQARGITALIAERDQAREQLEEVRIAYEATEAECNELVRELRKARTRVATSDLDV